MKNVTNDTLKIWLAAMRFMVYDRDPRRLGRLLERLGRPGDNTNMTALQVHASLRFVATAVEELSWRYGAKELTDGLFDKVNHSDLTRFTVQIVNGGLFVSCSHSTERLVQR